MPLIDDLDTFHDLFYRKRTPRNGAQETLVRAWDVIALVHSGGFESLIEQPVSLGEYAGALAEVGMSTAAPIVTRVQELLAGAPRGDNNAYRSFLQDHFENLNRLAEDFWAQSVNSDDLLLQYVNDHQTQFAEYLSGPTAGA